MPITLDGTLGITTPALTVTGATVNTGGISTAGNLTFTSTGNRILGDFSNATVANRVMFQTSTANGASIVSVLPNGSATNSQLRAYNNSTPTNASIGIFTAQSSVVTIESTIEGSGTYLPLTIFTGGSERLRIDTSGNVGIGTSSPTKQLSVVNATNTTTVGNNSVMVIQGGAGATVNSVAEIGFAFQTFSGTNPLCAVGYQLTNNSGAGNGALTFATRSVTTDTAPSERMRIDSSGNVGIGTASPVAKLDIVGSAGAANRSLKIKPSGNGADIPNLRTVFIENASNDGALALGFSTSTDAWVMSATYGSTGAYKPLVFATSDTERMRIDSSGNVGIGTSSPQSKLSVSNGGAATFEFFVNYPGGGLGTYIQSFSRSGGVYVDTAYDAATHSFRTSSVERMRIDSSGRVLVGKTAATVTAVGIELANTGTVRSTLTDSTNATSTLEVYSTGASNFRFYVGMGGTIFATSIAISAISDQRLKENIKDIDTGLDSIMALKPRRFDWKDGKGQDKKNVAGFIAQEFETVFPECVGTTKAGADGIEYKNINHETLIPTLVKAIQELNAEVQALKQQLGK